MAGNAGRPCHLLADHTRCQLVLHRSGTSLHLARLKRRVNLVSSRHCRGFLRGGGTVGRRRTELRSVHVGPNGRISRCLRGRNSHTLGSNILTDSFLHQPCIACTSLLRFVPTPRGALSHRIVRRVRVRCGCSNCVGGRCRRVRGLGHVRTGGVPRHVSCDTVRNLTARTVRGLAGVRPRALTRTDQVDNIGPTSLTVLTICVRRKGVTGIS